MTIFAITLLFYVFLSGLSFLHASRVTDDNVPAASVSEVHDGNAPNIARPPMSLPVSSPTDLSRVISWRKFTNDNSVLDIQLGSDDKGLLLSIVFSDRLCNNSVYNSYFTEADYRDIKAEQLGPDEIVVELSGASLQSRLAKSYDFCRHYFTHFQIPKSGPYRLRITRLRSDYDALRELDGFPRMNIDVIMDENVNHLDRYIPLPCSESNGYWM